MMKRRLLVPGGAGFIGSHLVDRLFAQQPGRVVVNDDVVEVCDPQAQRDRIVGYLPPPEVRVVEADLRDYKALHELVPEEVFDADIPLAAEAGVRRSVADPRG